MDKSVYYGRGSVTQAYEKTRFDSASGRWTHEQEMGAIKRYLSPEQHLIELACGTGRLMGDLLREGWRVIGIDQSEAMMAAASPDIRRHMKQADIFHLPFADNSVEGAFCFRFTNHYRDLRPMFKECFRALRPSGRLVFDTMRWSFLFWSSSLFGGPNFCISNSQTARYLQEAGFTVEESVPLFLIGPYWLARMPLSSLQIIEKSKRLIPNAAYAIQLWCVRKPN